MPHLNEVLMAPGDFTIEFNRDPLVEKELAPYDPDTGDHRLRHIVLRYLLQDAYVGVITKTNPRRTPYTISGRNLLWWLGDTERGAYFELLRLCSQADRISNGRFDLGELYWRFAEDSMWAIHTDQHPDGQTHSAACAHTVPLDRDDTLVSAESTECLPDDLMHLHFQAMRTGGDNGSLWAHIVFEGRFTPKNLLPDPGFDDSSFWTVGDNCSIVDDADNAHSGTRALKVGPTPKTQFIKNASFETDYSSDDWWVTGVGNGNVARDTSGDYPVHSGSCATVFSSGGADVPFIRQPLPGIQPGDELHISLWAARSATKPNTALLGGLYYPDEIGVALRASPDDLATHNLRRFLADATVKEDPPPGNIEFQVYCDDILDADTSWGFDDVSVIRTRGNLAETDSKGPYRGDAWFKVTPSRTYRVIAWVKSDPACNHGEVWLNVSTRKTDDSGDPDYDAFESTLSAKAAPTHGAWHRIAMDVTTGSGYWLMRVQIHGQDIYGGAFYVDDVSVVETDESTSVAAFKVKPDESDGDWITKAFEATAPTGTEAIHVEFAVEANHDDSWWIGDVRPWRVCTPDEAGDVVRTLIDGFMSEGNIEDDVPVLFDQTFHDSTAETILTTLSRDGPVNPQREWTARPDGSLDWGQPDSIFADRTDVIFVEDDIYVLGDPDFSVDVENFSTVVKVIGAKLTPQHGGPTTVVKGSATNPTTAKTFLGEDVVRAHIVADSSIDFQAYASARAQNVAEDDASQTPSIRFQVDDWTTLAPFDVGDWVYLYVPSLGIEDPDRPMHYEGRTVYPMRLRVLSRDRQCGKGWQCFVKREDGSLVELTDYVQWAPGNGATLELGIPRPSFIADPAGGAAGLEFLRWRSRIREG